MDWNINNKNSYASLTVVNWFEFIETIEGNFIDHKEYLYRGHGNSEWKLESTFDRKYRELNQILEPNLQSNLSYLKLLEIHLENFKKNSIGRRFQPNNLLNTEEWWALGQHYGLETPLLDWSLSPYIALYFALFSPIKPKSKFRTLWIFSPLALKEIAINQEPECEYIEEIDCPVDENIRLLSQKGKFTKTPHGNFIEDFIGGNINLSGCNPVLYRIDIPEKLREHFLRHLNSMNINHSTIFPDLHGATGLANRELERLIHDRKWKDTREYQQRLVSIDYLFHK